jgi:hypothetical protein
MLIVAATRQSRAVTAASLQPGLTSAERVSRVERPRSVAVVARQFRPALRWPCSKPPYLAGASWWSNVSAVPRDGWRCCACQRRSAHTAGGWCTDVDGTGVCSARTDARGRQPMRGEELRPPCVELRPCVAREPVRCAGERSPRPGIPAPVVPPVGNEATGRDAGTAGPCQHVWRDDVEPVPAAAGACVQAGERWPGVRRASDRRLDRASGRQAISCRQAACGASGAPRTRRAGLLAVGRT